MVVLIGLAFVLIWIVGSLLIFTVLTPFLLWLSSAICHFFKAGGIRNSNKLTDMYSYTVNNKLFKDKTIYILHYNTPYYFYNLKQEKLIKDREEAIKKLKDEFPDAEIYGQTLTLHNINKKYSKKDLCKYMHPFALWYSVVATFLNLENWKNRKVIKRIWKLYTSNKLSLYRYTK